MKTKTFCKPLSQLAIMVSVCMLSLSAAAYDFACSYLGKTLYFTITSSNTVKLVTDPYRYTSGDVVIPGSVTNNGTNYSVTAIAGNAFRNCSDLTSVTIPNSVDSIGFLAFSGCSSLTSVTIPNSVTYIGSAAFVDCISMISVNIPNSVTYIGKEAFQGCSGLIAVTIGNSVRNIDNSSFQDCLNLTHLTIGSSVERIGNNAFIGCDMLTTITSMAIIPPVIDGNVFPYPNQCSIIVPCGSLEAYTNQTCSWNLIFPNRIEEDCSALQSVENTREFVVYPNPARGFVTVEFGALQEHSLLRIADLCGRVVKTFDIAAGTETLRLDLRDLPSGVYTLMIGNKTKKLIVE